MSSVVLPTAVNGIQIGPDDVVIAPQKGPQTMFLRSKASLTIYGGSAGG